MLFRSRKELRPNNYKYVYYIRQTPASSVRGPGTEKRTCTSNLNYPRIQKKIFAGRLSESNKVSTMQYMRRVGAHTIMAVNMFLLSSIIELKWTMAGVSVHYNDQGGWSSSLELYLRRHGGLKTGDTVVLR